MIQAGAMIAEGQPRAAQRLGRAAGIVVKALLLVFLAVVIVRNAWVCDDAYITLRTVDNFIHGLGLRWNVHERVQAYTHPLWMFLLAGVYFLTREGYFTAIFLSVAVSMTAAALLVWAFGRSTVVAVFLVGVLASSKAFMDYTTSGVENPLTYLLTVVFLWLYLREQWTPRRVFHLALVVALAGLNRLDLLAIFVPPLVYAAVRTGWRRSLKPVAAGLAPLVLWELFALLYYGFPVPNTAYAKLNISVNRLDLAGQGLVYFAESFTHDPLTLIAIAAGLMVAFASRRGALVALAVGMVLYLLYVVSVGGDFMSGRFFSSLVIVAAVLLVTRMSSPPAGWVVLAGAAVAVSLLGSAPPILSGAACGFAYPAVDHFIGDNGITDERRFYYRNSGLLLAFQGRAMPTHKWARQGRQRRTLPPGIEVTGSIGFLGYFAGPRQTTIDTCALADPLLARLPPMAARGGWRVGHYIRSLPPGYYKSIETGQNRIRNKDLAEYYDRLCLVTRGRLFDPARLWEIVRFNLGLNDHLLRSYRDRPPLRLRPEEINRNAARGGTAFGHNGLEVVLGGTRYNYGFEVVLQCGSYCFIPSRGGKGFHALTLWPLPRGQERATWRIDIPFRQAQRGYDSVLILPILEDDPRFIDSFRLLGDGARPGAGDAQHGSTPAARG